MTAQQECPDDNAEAPNTEPASKVSDSTSIGDQATRDGHSGGEATTNGRLSDDHLAILAKSGITPEYAALRGYETITDCRRLAKLKIVKAARDRVPGLLVPLLDIRGSTRGYQYRPDQPRLREGKFVKYETPWKQANGLDIPPGVGPMLADPTVPLWITEGAKKADCGALHGLCIVDLPGVWSFIHTNASGGKTAIPDWYDIALNGRRVIPRVRRRRRPQGISAKGRPRIGRLPGAQRGQGRIPVVARHRRQNRPRRLPDGRAHRRGPVAAGQAAPASGVCRHRATQTSAGTTPTTYRADPPRRCA